MISRQQLRLALHYSYKGGDQTSRVLALAPSSSSSTSTTTSTTTSATSASSAHNNGSSTAVGGVAAGIAGSTSATFSTALRMPALQKAMAAEVCVCVCGGGGGGGVKEAYLYIGSMLKKWQG